LAAGNNSVLYWEMDTELTLTLLKYGIPLLGVLLLITFCEIK